MQTLYSICTFEVMSMTKEAVIVRENREIQSLLLSRLVKLDCYLPSMVSAPDKLQLLLINDGQDLETMGFHAIIEKLYSNGEIQPVVCIGIHASEDRRM